MDIYLILKAIVLGLVEGLTEFLPISSTGHLILVGDLLNFNDEKGKAFEVIIQFGAILAVCWEFREKLLKVKNEGSESGAADVSQVEAGDWVMHVCNHLTPDHPLDNINHAYYIERAERIIHKIQLEGKKRKVIVNPNQMSLF